MVRTVAGTTGNLGGSWRADVTTWGAVVPWDGSPVLDWAVAADDRWHRPADEVAVRQQRLAGTPVFETRLRIPGGDAVQRVWSAAGEGGRGLTAVEVRNDSPLAIAVAFTRGDVLAARPPAGVGPEGIDLPAGSVVLPVGHRAAVTVALAHDGRGAGPLPSRLAGPEQVARGWTALVERASRLVLPEERLTHAVASARSEVALAEAPDPRVDPVAFLLGLDELDRMGLVDDARRRPAQAVDVAAAVKALARRDGWAVTAALAAAAAVLARVGEWRAVDDVAALLAARPLASPPEEPPEGVAAVAAVERRLACAGALLPHGVPAAWLGAALEAHGLPIGPSSTLSFALRWHGERPAVLWEISGEQVALTAPALDPAWRTSEPCGEALWPAPPGAADPAAVGPPPVT